MARRSRDPSNWTVIILVIATIALLLYLQRHKLGPTPPGAPEERHENHEEENEGPPGVGAACGTERWAVKIMADPDASAIDLTHPRDTTVEALTSLPAPRWHEALRRNDTEKTVWRVRGEVTAVKLEEDSDYHIVLRGESGQTMVIEIPSPDCDQRSRVAAQISQARGQFRDEFRRWLGPRHGFHEIRPPQPVTVTGVGFFDKIHGQRGVAPNGIELHPLLSIELR